MKDLEEATENICRLKGEALAMQAMINAILGSMPEQQLASTLVLFDQYAEAAKTVLLSSDRVGQHVLGAFDDYVREMSAIDPFC